MKKIVLLLLAYIFGYGSSMHADSPIDVTNKVEKLGQPFSKPAYARNVWDMQLYDGKIYLGHGNSSNYEPDPNAGPIPIIYYDPAENHFVTEDVTASGASPNTSETKSYVDEEQIDTYKVINGKLYIPGHDARESWDYGDYYRLENKGWTKYRNLPQAIHVYDIAEYQGKLYAAVGTDKTPDLFMSDDNGLTWNKTGSIDIFGVPRAYTLFELKGNLYAAGTILISHAAWMDETRMLSVQRTSEKGSRKPFIHQTPIYASKMFPGITNDVKDAPPISIKIVRTTPVGDKLLYIAGETYNDHQWIPRGLFIATDINVSQPITLPNPYALPMDIIVRDHTTYVLAYLKEDGQHYKNIVYQSGDLDKWSEVFEFQEDTFARSFEQLNGDFYFGLGSYTDYIPESTGTILKVSKDAYADQIGDPKRF